MQTTPTPYYPGVFATLSPLFLELSRPGVLGWRGPDKHGASRTRNSFLKASRQVLKDKQAHVMETSPSKAGRGLSVPGWPHHKVPILPRLGCTGAHQAVDSSHMLPWVGVCIALRTVSLYPLTSPPALGAPSVDLLPLWPVQLLNSWFSFLGFTDLGVSAVRACWMAPATPGALGLPLALPCPGLALQPWDSHAWVHVICHSCRLFFTLVPRAGTVGGSA